MAGTRGPARDCCGRGVGGGLEPLRTLVGGLPADFPAAVLVVMHIPSYSRSALPAIPDRSGLLPAAHAVDGEVLQPGRIYVAPPDRHLLVGDGHIVLSNGPRENGHRPAADPTMRTAAVELGARAIAVVLSGALDDGTAGAAAVRQRGGVALVQSPDEALYPAMPRSAIEQAGADHVVPVAELAALLDTLAREPVDADVPAASELMRVEARMARMERDAMSPPERPGEPAGLSCPDCDGSLFEINEGNVLRFRCRVGHAWSSDSLVASQTTRLETALWVALRTLEDKGALYRKLAAAADERDKTLTARRFQESAREIQESAVVLRAFVENLSTPGDDAVPAPPVTP